MEIRSVSAPQSLNVIESNIESIKTTLYINITTVYSDQHDFSINFFSYASKKNHIKWKLIKQMYKT